MNLSDFLLDNDVVQLQAEAADWQTAIKLGTDMLERAGTITPDYYKGICKNMETTGPYFILGPGLAMPHARPEAGVLKTSFALVTLKTPVNFGDPDNDPIDIIITMAAANSEQQNEGSIVQIVELLDDEARVELLRKVKTKQELKEIFDGMEST